MALKSVHLDSMLQNREGKIVYLETYSAGREKDFAELMSTAKQKDKYFGEIIDHQNHLIESHKSEATDERKKKKGWKAASGVLGILLIIALL
jgi:hypothetical protein